VSKPVMAVNTEREYLKEGAKSDLAARQRIQDTLDQLSTDTGRRFGWRVLEALADHRPIGDTGASVYARAAKQAVAIEMVKDLKKRARDQFYMMEIENDKLG